MYVVNRYTNDDDHIYYGPTCMNKAENLALKKSEIIGIAAGCGGGVVVILFIVFFVLLKRKRTKEAKGKDRYNDLYTTKVSPTHNILNILRICGLKSQRF